MGGQHSAARRGRPAAEDEGSILSEPGIQERRRPIGVSESITSQHGTESISMGRRKSTVGVSESTTSQPESSMVRRKSTAGMPDSTHQPDTLPGGRRKSAVSMDSTTAEQPYRSTVGRRKSTVAMSSDTTISTISQPNSEFQSPRVSHGEVQMQLPGKWGKKKSTDGRGSLGRRKYSDRNYSTTLSQQDIPFDWSKRSSSTGRRSSERDSIIAQPGRFSLGRMSRSQRNDSFAQHVESFSPQFNVWRRVLSRRTVQNFERKEREKEEHNRCDREEEDVFNASILTGRVPVAKNMRYITVEQTLILASLVPDMIVKLHDPTKKSLDNFVGVLLFGDISGFTALTEKYTNIGLSGTYRLTATLNCYLGAMVDVIYFHGGDVLKFAGDAFLAVWKVPRFECVYNIIHRVIACSLQIQDSLGYYETDVKVHLRVKLAISAGNLTFSVIGDKVNRNYVCFGLPIDEARRAEHASVSGDVIIAPTAWGHCCPSNYVHKVKDEGFIKVIKILYDPRAKVREILVPIRTPKVVFPNEKIIQEQVKLEVIRIQEGDGEPDSLEDTNEHQSSDSIIRKGMIDTVTNRPSLGRSLRPLLIPPVVQQIDADQGLELLTEMRQVTTMFVVIKPGEMTTHQTIRMVDEAYCTISRLVRSYMGCVNKVILFDKDISMLCIFGLRGYKNKKECVSGLKCALGVKQAIREIDGVVQVSIGVTTGMTYCGVVGHPLRREYTVIGNTVNKAARIMMGYPGIVTCDDKTQLLAQVPASCLILQEVKQLKGLEFAGDIYEYINIEQNEEVNETLQKPLLGRSEELRAFANIASDYLKPNCTLTGLMFLGGPRVGKSRLLREVAAVAKTQLHITTVFVSLESFHLTMPYSFVYLLMKQVMGLDETAMVRDREDKIYNTIGHYIGYEWLCFLNDVMQVKFPNSNRYTALPTEHRIHVTIRLYIEIIRTIVQPLIVCIDDGEFVDPESWRIVDHILNTDCALLIGTYNTYIDEGDMSQSFLNHERVMKRELYGIQLDLLAPLACQILNVQAIPVVVERQLQMRSKGNPGWCENYLTSILRSGGLHKITVSTRPEFRTSSLVLPPLDLISFSKLPDSKADEPAQEPDYFEESANEPDNSDEPANEPDNSDEPADSIEPTKPDKPTKSTKPDKPTKSDSLLSNTSDDFVEAKEFLESEKPTKSHSIDASVSDKRDSADIPKSEKRDSIETLKSHKSTKRDSIDTNKSDKPTTSDSIGSFNEPDNLGSLESIKSFDPYIVEACLVTSDFDLSRNVVPPNMDALIIQMFDRLLPAEQLILKCGSVLGEVFNRNMLTSVLNQVTQEQVAQAIKRLFDMKILSCTASIGEEVGEQLCFCPPQRYMDDLAASMDEENPLPRYAFCMQMHFNIPLFRQTIYELLPGNQLKELHARAAEFLQNHAHRCDSCGGGAFTQTPTLTIMMEDEAWELLRIDRHTKIENPTLREGEIETETGVIKIKSPYGWKRKKQETTEVTDIPDVKSQSFSLGNSLEAVNFRRCECPLIMHHVYRQMVEHCRVAGYEEKQYCYLIELGASCIDIGNEAQAIEHLTAAEQKSICEPNKKLLQFNLGMIHLLKGKAYLHHNNIQESRYHLLIALRHFGTNNIFWVRRTGILWELIKLKVIRRFPDVLIGRVHGQDAERIDKQVACLLDLCAGYAMSGQWIQAKLAAARGLNLALEANCNMYRLTTAFCSLMTVLQKAGDFKNVYEIEEFALQKLRGNFQIGVANDLLALGNFYNTLFTTRLMSGRLVAAITIGFQILRICSRVSTKAAITLLVPRFVQALMMNGQVEEAMDLLVKCRAITRDNDANQSLLAWNHALSLDFCLDCGMVFDQKSNVLDLEFAEMVATTEHYIIDPYAYKRLIADTWLFYLRMKMWEEAEWWEEHFRDMCDTGPSSYSFSAVTTYLKLLECMLISMATNPMKDYTTTTEFLLKKLDKITETCAVGRPRYLHLKAYSLILSQKLDEAGKLLHDAWLLSISQDNVRETSWITHTAANFYHKLESIIPANFWEEHCTVDPVAWRKVDSDTWWTILYTLPTKVEYVLPKHTSESRRYSPGKPSAPSAEDSSADSTPMKSSESVVKRPIRWSNVYGAP